MRPKYTPKSLICKHGFYKCCMHRKYHWRSIPPMSIYIVSWLKSSAEMNPTNVGVEVLWFGRIALAFPVNKTKFDVISWRFSSSFFFVCNQDCVIFSRIHVPSSILINKYIYVFAQTYMRIERGTFISWSTIITKSNNFRLHFASLRYFCLCWS